jgi:hypothetical protein
MGPNVYVSAIAADSSDSATVFAAASNGVTNAIFKTTNGGTLWTLVASVGTSVNALAVDPVRPATIYLAGDDGVMVSSDGGSTWSPINEGLASNSAKSIAIDARGASLYAGTAASGVFSRVLTVIPPVQLVSVISRKVHPSAGTFDINLPLTDNLGIECRSGGANGDHAMVFTFANTLTSIGGVSVTNGTGSVSSSNIDSNDAHNYIVNLTGITNAQTITVGLTNVNDSAGNSSSVVSASMGLLLGDVTANGLVSNTDVASVKAQVAAPVTASNFRNDVNANATVSNTDVSTTKAQVGTSLP